ncbi:anhydro-N-acetylmuramic acid kinase [Ascidiimonas aurantiaca]|uniref:anhydro-N-acetylmuramic acid kinase n=1 Tax=Ascidiimonas aurantiaca TaxID=1685432 RepID=UPI0030EF311F
MNNYKVIGLMSGTSLDGLDMAYSHIYFENNQWQFSILETKSIEYTSSFREKLKNSVHLEALELLQLNNWYGAWLGQQVATFIEEKALSPDFIASHGHTVFHQPEKGITYQIGSGQHIANTCGVKVICDFRSNDLILGGQGAPFAPIGDEHFFYTYDFCLNLGGISNISFKKEGKRIAFDVSPANMLLNHIIGKIGKAYDHNGERARCGILNQDLLHNLNALEYYTLPYPKSLGYEWFLEKVIPIIDHTSDSIENLLHTSVHHIAEKIAGTIQKEPLHGKKGQLLVTGGGAKNSFFIETLQQKLGKAVLVVVPETRLIDFKEALVFGLMGALKECNSTNVLASVTGASRDSSSGIIYTPS